MELQSIGVALFSAVFVLLFTSISANLLGRLSAMDVMFSKPRFRLVSPQFFGVLLTGLTCFYLPLEPAVLWGCIGGAALTLYWSTGTLREYIAEFDYPRQHVAWGYTFQTVAILITSIWKLTIGT